MPDAYGNGPQGQPSDPTYSSTATPTPAPYKRSGRKKSDLLKKYRQYLDVSKKWRKTEHDDTWTRLVDLYRGKHFKGAYEYADLIAINVSFSTVNVIAPSVAVNYPEISVNARQPEDELSAETVQAMTNYWWRRYEYQPEVQRAVKDSLIMGHGWVKIGWRYETKDVAVSPEEQQQQLAEQQEQAAAQAEQDPLAAAGMPTDDELQGQVEQVATEVVEDRPFVERVSPFDIFIDPEAITLTDMKWIAQKLVLPYDAVVKDKRYSQAARSKLKPDSATNPRWRDDTNDNTSQTYNDECKRVTIWEFYDLQHGYMCVFADQGDDFLVAPTDFPYPFGHPFRYLPNYDVPDRFYGIGDLEMLEPLQNELNMTRSAMMNHRKQYSRAWIAKREAFTQDAKDTLASQDDNRVIWIEDDHALGEAIQALPINPLDAQLYQYSDVVESDMQLVSGVSEYERGATPETRRTATEASIIQDAANTRAADKLASIELFIREIAECVVMLAQEYLTGESVARVVGPMNAVQWVPFTRDDIQGQYDYEVEAGSTQPRNETYRRQQALQLANVLAPYVGVAVDPTRLVEYVLREGFGIKDASEFLIQPMIDPMTGLPMQGPPMGGPPGMAPPQGPPPDADLGEGTTLPTAGPSAIPPEVLTQLQGQVGLNLNNV